MVQLCVRALILLQNRGCRRQIPTLTRCLSTSVRRLQNSQESPDVDSSNPSRGSIDQSEVDKFSRLADHWWTVGGEFGALHNLNELRVPLVRDGLLSTNEITTVDRCAKPLDGKTILDVGCGGGILSEPLARLGATVTGLDASAENIAVANQHASSDPRLLERLTYTCSTVEEHSVQQGVHYDGVIASEILEHVSNPQDFVLSCCDLIKPGGSFFMTTLNKTLLSKLLAVVAAEQILKIVPAGAHDWDKFISPQTVRDWLEAAGFRVVLIHGMLLNPVTTRWRWVSDTSMNYALHAVKMT